MQGAIQPKDGAKCRKWGKMGEKWPDKVAFISFCLPITTFPVSQEGGCVVDAR